MIRTSYQNNDLNYGDIITTITKCILPKKIVEIGILDGYSLSKFIENSPDDTIIEAYDLFEEFNGNHANKEYITEKFNQHSNVKIRYGNFYNLHESIGNNIDILHIDIANNGDVLDFVIKNYFNLMSKNSVIIFEGGSTERDNIEWMNKYNKPKIVPVIEKLIKLGYNVSVLGKMPSITIINF